MFGVSPLRVQVMQVVREQITRALAMKPSSLDQLKSKLRGLSYSEILRLRQSERMSQDDFQSPPIMSVPRHTRTPLTGLAHGYTWKTLKHACLMHLLSCCS